MVEKHNGHEERIHTFEEVWERLNAAGPRQLATKAGTAFVAKAAITTKGKRRGERVIRYLQNGQEYGRCYECCWEHYYNCNRTRIGMYSRAVDSWLKSIRESRRMTAEGLLRTIEEAGGPGRLTIISKDLSGIDVGLNRISRLQMEVGDEPLWFSRSTGGVNLRGAVLILADFEGADLSAADLRGADIGDCSFKGTDLTLADFRGARMMTCFMDRVKLQSADLTGLYLDGSYLYNAYLAGAKLDRTSLSRSQIAYRVGEEVDGEYYAAMVAYRGLKANSESLGRYAQSAWARVKERRMERKTHQPNLAANFYGLVEVLEAFPECPGKLLRLRRWAAFYIRHTAQWLMSWVFDLICGYGESIPRVLFALVFLWFSSAVYYRLCWGVIGSSRGSVLGFRDYLLYSLGALTTTSFEHLHPRLDLGWIPVARGLEALVGIFLTGLLGFVVANRIRRS